MSFNSPSFLIFLPIVLVLYWVLPLRFRWIMLLAASCYFYMSWNAKLIFLIAFTTVVSYVAGIVIEKYKDKTKLKKTCLILTLVSCLGVLFFFKYFTFSVNLALDIANLFGGQFEDFAFQLILPVGISFYTFQTLSYVIDVYRGNIPAERHFGYYALFVTFFPQLVAGPIERPENLLPQLKEPHRPKADDLSHGLRIMAVGFFKKIVVADGVAGYVNLVYNDVASASAVSIIAATMLFALQIYCDFSGYTDIAIGVSRVMGIKLCDNFDQPYLATNIRGFWRRWHISLTSWFTDYVYIPLGGSRCRLWRWALNVMIVFLLSGLWHGAALTFVIWGALHGFYQIVGKFKAMGLKKLSEKYGFAIPDDNIFVVMVRRVITFALVCFAWIFFRANSLSDAFLIVKKLFTEWSAPKAALQSMGLNWGTLLQFLLFVGILYLLQRVIKHDATCSSDLGGAAVSRKIVCGYLVLAVAVAWLALSVSGMDSAFIYFQF